MSASPGVDSIPARLETVDDLRDALRKYGAHLVTCDSRELHQNDRFEPFYYGECDCGFDALLGKTREWD